MKNIEKQKEVVLLKQEFELESTDRFDEDIEKHKKSEEKSVLKKIDKLLDELREHPQTGTGKPELLIGDKAGQWSRRISKKHRLIYEINGEIVTFLLLSAYGHYDDK